MSRQDLVLREFIRWAQSRRYQQLELTAVWDRPVAWSHPTRFIYVDVSWWYGAGVRTCATAREVLVVDLLWEASAPPWRVQLARMIRRARATLWRAQVETNQKRYFKRK